MREPLSVSDLDWRLVINVQLITTQAVIATTSYNSVKLALILTHLSTVAFSHISSLGGISSVGRALAWHARGQEFDSPMLHHFHSVVMMSGLDSNTYLK